MPSDPPDPSARLEYKGHSISLLTNQTADETWSCQYVIVETGQEHSVLAKGYADGMPPSREAAELAALQKAKAFIDLL